MNTKVIELNIEHKEIIVALKNALEHSFLDNLRNRSSLVQLDSKIRGYIGEISIKNWFSKKGIHFEKTNYFDEYVGMDSDFIYYNNGSEIIVELKTSLIPDVWKNLDITLDNADIKIIKRTEKIEDLHGDFHIQIYFNKLRKERDSFLNSLRMNGINEYSAEELFETMKLDEYKTFFVTWIDKKTLISYINNLIKKNISPTWTFGYRFFWKCPIKEIGKNPIDIINALKEYKK